MCFYQPAVQMTFAVFYIYSKYTMHVTDTIEHTTKRCTTFSAGDERHYRSHSGARRRCGRFRVHDISRDDAILQTTPTGIVSHVMAWPEGSSNYSMFTLRGI